MPAFGDDSYSRANWLLDTDGLHPHRPEQPDVRDRPSTTGEEEVTEQKLQELEAFAEEMGDCPMRDDCGHHDIDTIQIDWPEEA